MPRSYASLFCALVCWVGAAPPLAAQDSTTVIVPVSAWQRSEFRLPALSLVVPGLGQYVHGAHLAGAAYTTSAVAGLVLARAGNPDALELGRLPRVASDQLGYEGIHILVTSGLMSAWDTFHRAVPALQGNGNYQFLTTRETAGSLLTAPFDPTFLGRWTTWIDLAYTGLVTGLILASRDAGVEYEPLRMRDAAFATSLSLNAGVGEEAAFRGWLLPVLNQKFGERFWLANTTQAGIFGLLHPQAGAFAAVIAGWAVYEGWLTRRNDWSVRESIFHHFWYDVAVVTATFLTDERQVRIQLTLPTIRF